LPELEPDREAGEPDLVIRLRPTGRGAPETFSANTFEFGESEQFMCWPLVGAFLMHGTHVIDVERAPGVSDQLLPFPLLGPVLAVLLHLRGYLVLHASAVAKNGKSAIFVGDKMAGKSTTAATFVREGWRLITDDVLAIDLSHPPRIVPGFPQIKLAEDAERAVRIEGAEALPLVLPDFEKRQQRLSGGFSHETVAPSAVYVLTRGEQPGTTRLGAAEALSAVMQFSYISRFATRPLVGDEAREHLRHCARLVNAAPVYRLAAPTGLDRLPQAVALVEREIGAA
jgi:hypothetical protein